MTDVPEHIATVCTIKIEAYNVAKNDLELRISPAYTAAAAEYRAAFALADPLVRRANEYAESLRAANEEVATYTEQLQASEEAASLVITLDERLVEINERLVEILAELGGDQPPSEQSYVDGLYSEASSLSDESGQLRALRPELVSEVGDPVHLRSMLEGWVQTRDIYQGLHDDVYPQAEAAMDRLDTAAGQIDYWDEEVRSGATAVAEAEDAFYGESCEDYYDLEEAEQPDTDTEAEDVDDLEDAEEETPEDEAPDEFELPDEPPEEPPEIDEE